jgi:hypothetical protein
MPGLGLEYEVVFETFLVLVSTQHQALTFLVVRV